MALTRYTWRTFSRELVLLAIAAIWLVPFYFLVAMSLKPNSEIFNSPLSPPHHFDFHNYILAWNGNGRSLGRALFSSTLITSCSVALLVVFGSLAAYTIARRAGKLSNALYFCFVFGIILPYQLAVIPAYVILRHFHLTGSYTGMILLYVALMMPLAVFMYTGFIRAVPRDYEEAAQVDGAGVIRTYVRVVFPLLRPVTGTVAVLTAIIIWNDFFNSVIFLSGTTRETLPVAIYTYAGEQESQWNAIFAAIGISIVPILAFFFVAQRQLIRGFTGGIKT